MKIFEMTNKFPKDKILGKLVAMGNNSKQWVLRKTNGCRFHFSNTHSPTYPLTRFLRSLIS